MQVHLEVGCVVYAKNTVSNDDYERGYTAGHDAAGYDSSESYEEGYQDALKENNIGKQGNVDNLCLKCDCKKFGFDCMLVDPRAYMENKLWYGEPEDPPKWKKVINENYDRAMEIFHPK